MFGIFEKSAAYTDLYGADFEKKLKEDKNAMILDVRTASEFSLGRIPGAVNIDIMRADFGSRIASLDKNKTYFVYCRSGSRSGQACSLLAASGFKSYNLADGISSWRGTLVR